MTCIVKHAWSILNIPASELRLDMTLLCGQVFTWQKKMQNNLVASYYGVLDGDVIELQETQNDIQFRQILFDKSNATPVDDLRTRLHKFFNYNQRFNLTKMNLYFAEKDPNIFAPVYTYYPGVRVIQQDPLECLICFICSSNNNVARITLMITRLCQKYGQFIGSIDDLSFYKFPNLNQLSTATEEELKELGFGYRANYVVKTVQLIKEKQNKLGSDFLASLRNEPDRNKVIDSLMEFQGVGCKVAACVALYSMDKFDCVPVDVHISRLARLHYTSLLSTDDDKTLLEAITEKGSINAKNMKKLMQMFVKIFGENAGWAQMILYGCQIAAFKTRMPLELRQKLFSEKVTITQMKKTEKKVNKEKMVKKETIKEEILEKSDIVPTTRMTRSRSRKLEEILNGKDEELSPQKRLKK
jgi:N-glycosylase/DNA lyase